jgi:hypothetical protein
VIFLPDSSIQPPDSFGASIITISKIKLPRFERVITNMHPIY